MPHVSRNKLSKEMEEELVKNLTLVLAKIDQDEGMVLFLEALLSDTERLMLAKRLAIIILIEEDMPDLQIANMLHVTRITVSKMRYFYEARGKGFAIGLKKLDEQQKLKNFKKVLLALARYSARAAGGYVKPTILDPKDLK